MRTLARGYTLLELMITLAVLAILASTSLPDMGKTLQAHAGETFINDLARIMSRARSAAVSNGSIVTLCRSKDGSNCGGEWHEGMLLFTDHNSDQLLNGDDQILLYRVAPRFQGNLKLRSFPNRQYVQFTPLGFTKGQSGNFTWCPSNNTLELAQQLIFSQAGRSRLARDSDGDGIREGADGNPLNCE